MTAGTTSPVQVGSVLATLPRVDLLPAEIGDGARLRRMQAGLALAVLAAVGVVAVVAHDAAGSVSDGRTQVAAASADQAQVQHTVDGYRSVTQVYAQVAAAQAALRTAMSREVRYSGMLDDLSRAVPSSVWLTNAAYTEGAAAAPGAAGAAGLAAAASGSVGSVALTGVALTHDAVADWLDVLAQRKGFGLPVLSNQAEATVGGHVVVNWTLTVPVTDAALSGRYTTSGG